MIKKDGRDGRGPRVLPRRRPWTPARIHTVNWPLNLVYSILKGRRAAFSQPRFGQQTVYKQPVGEESGTSTILHIFIPTRISLPVITMPIQSTTEYGGHPVRIYRTYIRVGCPNRVRRDIIRWHTGQCGSTEYHGLYQGYIHGNDADCADVPLPDATVRSVMFCCHRFVSPAPNHLPVPFRLVESFSTLCWRHLPTNVSVRGGARD